MIYQASALKFILLISSFLIINNNSVTAQITPDNTLGAESSRVVPDGNIDKIDGGALRDKNLFHSFKEFNINNGQSAYFNNPSGVENILTRVTGGNASNILGTLGVDGAANLFLINPNGIIFGENARLDVQGSFVGSTASGLQFGEQGNFSATNPEAPGLLTVNPNALFFNQMQANGGIINKSQAPAGINPNGNETTGLRVPDGKSLLLVGGDINLDEGGLNALGGELELAGLAGEGKIGLNINANKLNLSVPDDVERADISITNGAKLDVSAGGGGSITISARNLELKEGSQLLAGIREGLGTPEAQAGDIKINAASKVLLDNQSYIFNDVKSGGVGNAGNVSISTSSLEVLNGSQVGASTFGEGDAGNVTIKAIDLAKFDGEDNNGFLSGAASLVQPGAEGGAGNVSISTGFLEVLNGAFLSASTFGKGDAGSVEINATNSVKLDGESQNGFPSGAVSQVLGVADKAGGVSITTGSLEVLNGALLSTSTFGEGDAGSVKITATDLVKFNGESKNGFPSGATSQVEINAVGKAGGVSISTGSLEVLNGAFLSANTFGKGDAGSVEITATGLVKFDGESKNELPSGAASQVLGVADKAGGISISSGSLEVLNGALLSASTFGKGDAGSVKIIATDLVKIDGESKNGFPSAITSQVEANASGKAGGISISTTSLEMLNGAQLSATTFGGGNAGSVKIIATDLVKFDGESKNGIPTGVASQVEADALGEAGGISISTSSLEVFNGAQLSTSTYGKSDAGKVEIIATDLIKFDGESRNGFRSGVSSQVQPGAKGNAGGISIVTGSLELFNGAQLSTSTYGKGNAGSVEIIATDLVKFDGESKNGFSSGVTSQVQTRAEGNAGGIFINTNFLEVLNSAQITASTFGKGDAGSVEISSKTFEANNGGTINNRTSTQFPAGNIILNVTDNIALADKETGIFANTTEGSTGKGGSIIIDPRIMTVRDGARISVNSQGEGIGGDIELAAGFLTLDNGNISAQTRSNTGGNITLNLQDVLLLRNNSQISSTAGNQQFGGDGGNISINSPFIVAVPKEDSDITANAFTGNGGNVDIVTQGIFGINPAAELTPQSNITASSSAGIQGEISVTDPEINPTQGVIELPSGLVDKSDQVAQICPRGANAERLGEFIITGKGSVPPSPLSLLEGTVELSRLATLDDGRGGRGGRGGRERRGGRGGRRKQERESQEIVEARGFVKNADGEIYLVAQASSTTPNSGNTASACAS